jgi:hypothetical protein
LFREDLDFLSAEDVEAVMGANVLAWLGWPVADQGRGTLSSGRD